MLFNCIETTKYRLAETSFLSYFRTILVASVKFIFCKTSCKFQTSYETLLRALKPNIQLFVFFQIRSGDEYTIRKYEEWLAEHGSRHDPSAPYTLEQVIQDLKKLKRFVLFIFCSLFYQYPFIQNGVLERVNRNII